MPEAIEKILVAIAASEGARAILKVFAVEFATALFTRHAADPEFAAKSDATVAAFSAAKTPEELTNAQNALRTLLSD